MPGNWILKICSGSVNSCKLHKFFSLVLYVLVAEQADSSSEDFLDTILLVSKEHLNT